MKIKYNISIFAIIIACLFILTSCGKYRLNRSTDTAEDNSLAENMFNDVFKVVDKTIKNNINGTKDLTIGNLFGSCDTIIISPSDSTFPKTVTIDFGTTNCTCNDGRSRRGKLIATITNYYRKAGCVITVTPQDYYVNDNKVEGTKTVTNKGKNNVGHTYYEIVVNGTITTTENKVISWTSTRQREWIEGEATTGMSGIADDVYLITGNATGIDRNGNNFTVTITKALRVELDCRWITEGTIDIIPQDLKTRTIDFGSGVCDNDATVTIANKSYPIKMR